MTTILVTGGMGFIGSNFIRCALNKYKDYKIINLDKLTYAGNLDNLKDIKDKRYRFVKGDICNRKIVDTLMKKSDIVINFAAETHVDRSILDAGVFVKTDVLGTYTLLESAKRYNIKKFLQISTDEVYGSVDTGSFLESSPLSPNSPYAASKASADLLVRSYYATYKFPVLITRSSNNFGPYQYPEKLIPLFVTNAIDNLPLPVYGDGMNVRDWLYVTDNCEAIDAVLQSGEIGGIYNIGGGNEKTNLEITNRILKRLGKPEKLIMFVKDRPGHDRRYSIGCSKIKKMGWKTKYSFEDALNKTIDWYVENEWLWRKLKKRKDF
ncbi:MAG: dTDP-glucose 4,6-dehydratase [Thermoplasmata archaeon]